MTFLPIVERELRVASRRRSTGWLRVIAGLVALVIASGCVLLSVVARSGTANFGSVLFGILTWLSLVAALCSGLFLTADSLSEEKREGTLGFLFLTDLRGYDVVLGKLIATSLCSFYALLAVLPVLGVTLLMGGVTGAQFWKTTLALFHALFISLAAGLLISTVSRHSQKALAGTFLLLSLLAGSGPLADWLQSEITKRPFRPCFSLASPVFVFMSANAWGRSPYWVSLLLGQVLGWCLLGLGCFLVPRTWQETARKSSSSRHVWNYDWKYGTQPRREALRRKLLGMNPVLWLACRERWQGGLLWGLALPIVGGAMAVLITDSTSAIWIVLNSLFGVVYLALYLWIASQACRFFVDARRSGLVELLLATPLDARQIVQGQWRALVRAFGLPVLLLLGAQIVVSCLGQRIGWTGFGSATAPNIVLIIATAVMYACTGAANLVALAWFGMWMGMTSRNNSLATLKAVAFVQVIPWFIVSFLSTIIVMLVMMLPTLTSGFSSSSSTATKGPGGTATTIVVNGWIPLLMAGVAALLNGGKDVGFFLWARKKLYSGFREQASRAESHLRPASPRTTSPPAPPPTPTSMAAPPIIASRP